MSTASGDHHHRYIVYLPRSKDSKPCPIRVPKNADVDALDAAIRKHPNFKHHVEGEQLTFYKCGILNVVPRKSCYGRTMDWLCKHARDEEEEEEDMDMGLTDRLNEYFPDGPVPEDKKMIDVIVVTKSKSLDDTVFGSNKQHPARPHKDDNEMNRIVEEFFKRLDRRLCEHLKGLPWKDVWQASEDTQPHYAQFIENLGIPQVLGRPALLLHCLGDGVVDAEILSELADGSSKILTNTSGSGKTRLLIELLAMKWGFYFTTAADFANLRLGSQDVYDAIFMRIPNHTNFTEKPKDVHSTNSPELEPAYRRNHSIVARLVYQILTARVIVFEHFLTTFRTLWPGGNKDINEAKLYWLSLQLNSSGILGCDVFKDLAKILDDASNNFIMMDSLEIQNRLFRAISEFKLDSGIFLVLDEAQVAAEQLTGCFRSYQFPEKPHAVLSPIIKSWLAATSFPIIVSSTGLSLNMINETVTSAVGKPATFLPFTTTGAFDDKVRQEKYIRRYTPPGFLDSDSGKEFLQRAWNFARGRHRFTAALLTQLLRASFQSPHRTLNAFVKSLCKFTPADAEQFINAEPEIREGFGAIIPLDFTKITSRVDVLCNVSRALYKWLVLRTRLPFENEKDDLIELGFARLVNDPEKGYIDEPLVLLGAAQEFSKSSFSLECEALSGLQSHEGRGEHFEEFVAYSLACAFDGERKLCELFSFGEHVPDWAQQCAELVALTMDNGVVMSNRFHLPQYLSSTTSIGKRCETVDVTLEWFRNPSSVICFPDKYMGPDIVLFVCLDSGSILAIEVKCKWVSKGTLDKEAWESAVSTLDLAQLYRRKSLGARKTDKARGTVLDLFNCLNPITPLPNDKWFQDRLPVLRVIASFPATPFEAQRRGSTYYTTFNMEYCSEVTHATRLLESVSLSLLNVRKYTGDGSAVVPAKRQHT
ncbi:uncharacterized protein FOMMEDRAFT_156540 [Fomitiporia mediterranea MF3/22]|uniref:uncharacterized protein n=1 Tax=Fomitiporia mediterranea (strain MF3/22) TaxID=694068 RepID=UPI0004407BE7|nr:uncharacterized protein FOMMEDRAFT_156540 [Fomitiporia mediterranea MF3/22]EJD03166.1 hypothetical protein FOMMEDRAFT_156540 [Fomitiporia mediterranea MF3/22]